MENENIKRAKKGDTRAINELYEKYRKIIIFIALKYYNNNKKICDSAGVQKDDLIQEGYFAFLKAVKDYDEKKGFKLSAYLNYHLKNTFNTLCGLRNKAGNVLNNSLSINQKIKGAEDLFLYEVIKDDKNSIEDIQQKIYKDTLHNDLMTSINELQENEKQIIKYRYFNNLSLRKTGKKTGQTITVVRSAENKALKKLRYKKQLQVYRDDIISTHAYKSYFSLWKSTGYSSTEYTAIKLIEGIENRQKRNY